MTRLTIRWRLAVTSGGLTLAILAVFAVVFGLTTTRQLRSDFDEDLVSTAADLRQGLDPEAQSDVLELIAAGDAVVRITDTGGRPIRTTPGAPDLGPPTDGVTVVGGYRVASTPAGLSHQLESSPIFIQYAKPDADLKASIARVRLFLVLGVLAGAALALLAGHAVAGRAMAPIADLTAAARHVARTRNPEVRLPKPEADDEVAALANTLEEMLMALNASRRETEGALDQQRQFVANASHELRTPLTSVLANLEILEQELGAGDTRDMASSALRSTRRMRRLVADLLLLARADAGRVGARRPVELAPAVAAACAEAAPLAAQHEIRCEAAEGVAVEGVPDDLHRLVLNLVENALRHTPAGTLVRVEARREAGAAVLVVEDDGPGIAPEVRERVFERFVRSGDDGGGGGSGLGLAIVRAVAEAHGGRVSVGEGPWGRGARFEVTLPLAAALPEPDPAPAPPMPPL
ncbi:MAG TPA: HAMP domain-containing sensor histidine kinase [Thermoleophilaceae bacterium]|nr:HAMP domain-containing sensor histidine kinase [Thermoleophilaceae bacterium]